MPIDLSLETVVSLTEAARDLPRRRAGKRTHVATVYRWANRGLGGVRLETIQIGGTRCTSREALQRFCDRLAQQRNRADPSSALAVDRTKRVERTQRRLAKEGI